MWQGIMLCLSFKVSQSNAEARCYVMSSLLSLTKYCFAARGYVMFLFPGLKKYCCGKILCNVSLAKSHKVML